MFGALRIVFAWLLAAALPLQGLAAASMTCGARGQSAPVHGHDHDAARGHQGHHHDAEHSEAVVKCSICAACCASMAIAAADFALPLVALSESFASSLGAEAFLFVTDGLERPPRTSSFA